MAEILVVRGDNRSRERLCLTLEREGFSVVGSAGSKGIDRCVRANGEIKVAVVDEFVGKQSGVEVARRIRAHIQGRVIQILLLGDFAGDASVVARKNSGIDEMLPSPLGLPELVLKLRTMLAKTQK